MLRHQKIFYHLFFVAIFLVLLGCAQKENQFTTVDFTIYGMQETPLEYTTNDVNNIEALQGIMESYVTKDCIVLEDDIPKGISYILQFEGDNTHTYQLINGYVIYHDQIYKISAYNQMITSIYEIYNIVE